MTETLQFRRGTTAKTAAFTGAAAELTVDTDKNVAVVHDGTTPGGHPLVRDDLSNVAAVAADLIPDQDGTRSLGSVAAAWKDGHFDTLTVGTLNASTLAGATPTNVAGTMMVLVQEQVISSPTSSVTFTGLNGDEDIEYEIRGNLVGGTTGTIALFARPNGDSTAANYKAAYLQGNGTAAISTTNTAWTGMFLTAVDGTSGHAPFHLTLNAKSGVPRQATLVAGQQNTATTVTTTDVMSFMWTNTTNNITSLTITAASAGNGFPTAPNGIGAGTRIALYARKRVGGTASNVSASFRGALLKRTDGSVSFPSGTWVAIPMQAAQYDSDGFWVSGTATRVTIPAGVNKIRLSGSINYDAGSIGGHISFRKNGTFTYPTTVQSAGTGASSALSAVSPVIPVQAGDYFELMGLQSSGATHTLATNNTDYTYLGIEVVDPVPVAISGFGSNTTADYAHLGLSENQTTGLAVGNYVKFGSITGSGITLDSATGKIRLKAGKTYSLSAHLFATFSANNGQLYMQWRNVTANTLIGSQGGSDNGTATFTQTTVTVPTAVITPMVDTEVALEITLGNSVSGIFAAYSTAMVTQIGGPANGLNYGPAGYASLSFTGDPTTLTTTTDAILAFPNLTGNLTASNGGVVLKAGRTYLLQASVHTSSSATGGFLNYRFHNGTAYIGNAGQSLAASYPGNSGANTVATAIYRPAVDTTVTLRCQNAQGTISGFASASFFNVVELAAAVDTYSTNETLTDKVWYDGKPIWRKVIDFGAMPNATTKQVPHGITGITNIVSVTGVATGTGGDCYPLPRAHQTTQYIVDLYADKSTYVSMGTGFNYSTGYTAKIILEYTK